MPLDTGLVVAVQLVLALAVSLEVFVDIFYEVSANPRRSAHPKRQKRKNLGRDIKHVNASRADDEHALDDAWHLHKAVG